MFLIFDLESMLLQVAQVVILLAVILSGGLAWVMQSYIMVL